VKFPKFTQTTAKKAHLWQEKETLRSATVFFVCLGETKKTSKQQGNLSVFRYGDESPPAKTETLLP
jgi:hypothetical protein